MFNINFADDWFWKRLLYHLSHNHCPISFVVLFLSFSLAFLLAFSITFSLCHQDGQNFPSLPNSQISWIHKKFLNIFQRPFLILTKNFSPKTELTVSRLKTFESDNESLDWNRWYLRTKMSETKLLFGSYCKYVKAISIARSKIHKYALS